MLTMHALNGLTATPSLEARPVETIRSESVRALARRQQLFDCLRDGQPVGRQGGSVRGNEGSLWSSHSFTLAFHNASLWYVRNVTAQG